MKKNIKNHHARRITSLLIVLCMVLSIVPITAYAGVTDVTGGTTTNTYTHTYHTKVTTIGQVTIKDADGNVIETTEVTKSGDFIEGNVSDDAVQAEIDRIDAEIAAQYSSRGSITIENRNSAMVFDHFESTNIITGDTILVGDQDALENAASGSVNKNLDVHEYQVYQTTYDLIVQENNDLEEEQVITKVDVGNIWNVKFDYRPGDAPQATAQVSDTSLDQYEIAYECWEEMENGNPVAFWYSDESKYIPSMKKITQFEEGKTYMYSIELREKNGYTFADNCSVTINGNPISATANVVKTVDGLFAMNVETIRPEATKEISVIEINNATLTFKDGDKPVFTGTTPDDAPYVLVFEEWRTDGEWTRSDEWFNNADHHGNDKDITAFDKNKSYNYTLYIKTNSKGAEEGWYFGQNTKLKINKKEVSFTRDVSDSEYHFSGTTGITMTPTAAGASDYKMIEGANGTWTQNSNGTLVFRANGDFSKFTGVKVDGTLIDAKNYTAVSGSTVITLKADYLKTLSGGTHKITVVYTDGECSANFEVKKAASEQTKPTEGDKADTTTPTGGKDTTSPQTGDNSNLALWFAVLFVSGAGALGTTVYSKRKKRME